MKYLAAIEEGLRNYGNDIHAMGTAALVSRANWGFKVEQWRKREGYIALIRKVWARDDYKQWDCFLFQDYRERQLLACTFTARHLPLSDGKKGHFHGLLTDPPSWNRKPPAVSSKMELPKKMKKKTKKKKSDASATASSSTQQDAKPIPMIFDVEKGQLMPYV